MKQYLLTLQIGHSHVTYLHLMSSTNMWKLWTTTDGEAPAEQKVHDKYVTVCLSETYMKALTLALLSICQGNSFSSRADVRF